MKTPKEIKKGLEHCAIEGADCTGCVYRDECMEEYDNAPIQRDALAYIQQLEEKVSKLEKRCDAEQLNATYAITELKEVKRRMLRNVEIIMNTFPKWISVEERLPENCVEVLLYYKKGYLSMGYWDDDLCEWDGMTDEKIVRPDYWMPLPEPLKEGT